MTSPARERRAQLQGGPIAQLERIIELRLFEDAVDQLGVDGSIYGITHTAQGQEAVAVGVASATRFDDYVTCTYRGHGHALALGIPPQAVMGEILGRSNGVIGGLGGTMHLSEPDVGLLPTFAIVGAGIPVAVGAALSARYRGTDQVAVAVFGDGTTNIGAFHEGLNLAAIWQLPVVFVCENNVYGEYTRIDLTTPVTDVAVRADSYKIPWRIVDGQDVEAVAAAVADAVRQARSGQGPTFLEMKTYRYRGHSRADEATYRPDGELDAWLERDPIEILRSRLEASGALSPDEYQSLCRRVADRIEAAVQESLSSPLPDVAAMFANVWASPVHDNAS